MKKKKVRSGKPVKGAPQPLRPHPRVSRTKSNAAKIKVTKGKRVRKSKTLPAAKRAAAAPKAKRTKRPVLQEAAPEIMPLRPASEPPALTTTAGAEPESAAISLASLQASSAPAAPGLLEKPAPAQPSFKIPPLLLEGDEPPLPPATGPGQKYALGPMPPAEQVRLEEGELPEAYGTGDLLLTARDPHWLYAHWDLTDQQQRRYNASAADHHLAVRIYLDRIGGPPVAEVQVHPESRHWFIHVERAGVSYLAELGYYQPGRQWMPVATSAAVLTPPETVAEDKTVRWAIVTPAIPAPQFGAAEKKRVPPEMVETQTPLRPAEERFQTAPLPPVKWASGLDLAEPEFHGGRFQGEFPAETPAENQPVPTTWTPAQERALAEEVGLLLARQTWTGSAEITELIGRQLQPELPGGAVQRGLPAPTGVAVAISSPLGAEMQGISSPPGGEQPQPRGFWFNVNAELVIYGATEPDARVAIGGRLLKLRPDGTFSCRFSLPDGQYELAVTATSAHDDSRRAELKFSRCTEYKGEVGAHPQDKALKPPAPENVSALEGAA